VPSQKCVLVPRRLVATSLRSVRAYRSTLPAKLARDHERMRAFSCAASSRTRSRASETRRSCCRAPNAIRSTETKPQRRGQIGERSRVALQTRGHGSSVIHCCPVGRGVASYVRPSSLALVCRGSSAIVPGIDCRRIAFSTVKRLINPRAIIVPMWNACLVSVSFRHARGAVASSSNITH